MGNCTATRSKFVSRAQSLHCAYLEIINHLRICIENLECFFNDRKFSCNLKNFSEYLQFKLSKIQDEILLKQIYIQLNEIKTLRSKLNVLFEINEQLDSQFVKVSEKKSQNWTELESNITQTRNSAIILYNSLNLPDFCFEDAKTLIISYDQLN